MCHFNNGTFGYGFRNGMLLGVPIVVMMRMVAQHIESLHALDALLDN